MEKWEYLIAQAAFWNDSWGYSILDDKGMPSGEKGYIIAGLNQLGGEGWELTGIGHTPQYTKLQSGGRWQIIPDSSITTFFFKRRKP